MSHAPIPHGPDAPSPVSSPTGTSARTLVQPPPVPAKPSNLHCVLPGSLGKGTNDSSPASQTAPSSAMTSLGPPVTASIMNENATANLAAQLPLAPTKGLSGSSPRIRSAGLLNASNALPRDAATGKDQDEAKTAAGQRSHTSSPTPSSNGSFHTPTTSLSASPNAPVPSGSTLRNNQATSPSIASNEPTSSSTKPISRKSSALPIIGITASSPTNAASSSTPSPFPSNSSSPIASSSPNAVWGGPPPLPSRRPNALTDHGRKSSISRGIQQLAGGLGFFGATGRSGSSTSLSAKSSAGSGGSVEGGSFGSVEARRDGIRGSSPKLGNGSSLGNGTGSTGGPSRWLPRRGSGSSTGSSNAKVEVGLGLGLASATSSSSSQTANQPPLPPRHEQREVLMPPEHASARSRSPSPRRDRLSSYASLEDGISLGVPPLPARAMATAPIPPRGKSEDIPRTAGIVRGKGLNDINGIPPPSVTSRRTADQHVGLYNGSNSKAEKGRELLGSAVSTGWSAFNKAKSRGGQAISHLREQRAAAAGEGGLTSVETAGYTSGSSALAAGRPPGDGPYLAAGVIRRRGNKIGARVFGVDVQETGSQWKCECSEADAAAWDTERRARMMTLPAVAVRCVDYLMVWTPDEEGIFRISGRSSHIALLRKTFDTGGDLDLTNCDPGDIDPHAVASLYKSYLRELPSPILTAALAPLFDALIMESTGVKAQEDDFGAKVASLQLRDADARPLASKIALDHAGGISTDLVRRVGDLVARLPEANRYLLSDLARLLAWTSSHSAVNKMTLQNLLMVFCPSISLSPPFMKLLVEHHGKVFDGRRPAQGRELTGGPVGDSGKENEVAGTDLDLLAGSGSMPSLVTDPSVASSMASMPRDLAPGDTATGTAVAMTAGQPSSTRMGPVDQLEEKEKTNNAAAAKYSTPIADRFARTGPVTLSLRDHPVTSV